ncbi:MAG: acetylxylan esterase [Bacteroidetes bacterium]|nr:acetylxylan esterase [Bacteroidota bacterium]
MILYTTFFNTVCGQTLDNEFKEPLKDVLTEIQSRYQISIEYADDLVKDKWVSFARWRFRPDAEQTLQNILSLNDIVFEKQSSGKYKLHSFDYYEQTPEEGVAQLKMLAGKYNNKAEWENRKNELRSCIMSTLAVKNFPDHLASAPILTPVRIYDDYSVQNFALETLPGVYICGSIYKPRRIKGKIPVVFNPDGHFEGARYRPDCQYRAATLARMGMISVTYDLFGFKCESLLQVDASAHYKSHVQPLQVISAMRIFDFILSMKEADTTRVAITGASGGGSQAMLMTAVDNRIKLSVPVVMMSSYFAGGCPCESGMGIHLCGEGTNNVEIAALAAPRPQLVISDGHDWTKYVPVNDFPFLQRIYDFYGNSDDVENVHLANEVHDYGPSKRQAMYAFVVKHFHLVPSSLKNADGTYSEKGVVIEKEDALKTFGADGSGLPANALKGWDKIETLIKHYMRGDNNN